MDESGQNGRKKSGGGRTQRREDTSEAQETHEHIKFQKK